MSSRLEELHKERFPDHLFNTTVKVKELNDMEVPFSVFKILQWRQNPWQWLVEQVITVDESDNSIKPFPNFQYLQYICDLYFQRKIIVVPKTRRMMLTHLFLSGVLPHQLLFLDNSDNIFVSMSETKAKKAFRKRARKTLENLDPRFGFYPEFTEGKNLLTSMAINPDTGSELSAIPSGADKCRGDTINNAVYDEFAFQTNCEENLAALKPALEGKNCRGAIISSPNPGTVFEELTKIREGGTFKQLMQGLSVTENELNHLIIKCHYKAHPYKRSNEWYYRERYGTTPEGVPLPGSSGVSTFTWLQEYEGEFNFPRGDRAITEFSEELHCQTYTQVCPNGYIPAHTLFISFDFGSRFPAVCFIQADSFNRAIIHDGLMVANERFSAFLVRTRAFLDENFEGWEKNFKLFCDPAGFKENNQGVADDPAAIELERFFKKRVSNRNKICRPIVGIKCINEQAAAKIGPAHGLIVNPSAGRFINEVGKEEYGIIPKAFAYGYCYKKKTNVKEKGQKDTSLELEKDGFWDHFVDTIRYIFQYRWKSQLQMKDQITEARTTREPRKKKRLMRS